MRGKHSLSHKRTCVCSFIAGTVAICCDSSPCPLLWSHYGSNTGSTIRTRVAYNARGLGDWHTQWQRNRAIHQASRSTGRNFPGRYELVKDGSSHSSLPGAILEAGARWHFWRVILGKLRSSSGQSRQRILHDQGTPPCTARSCRVLRDCLR